MKLSQLRPCDKCGGSINPTFYVVRSSQAMILANHANTVMGLSQMFRGNLALAEAMAPQPEVVVVLGDEDKNLQNEIILCQRCYAFGDIAGLVEKRIAAAEENEDE